MQLDLVSEAWLSLKGYINPMDRKEAAQSIVSALIDNGVDAEDIQSTFQDDADIRSALSPYLEELDDEDTEDEYNDFEFDDDDKWDN